MVLTELQRNTLLVCFLFLLLSSCNDFGYEDQIIIEKKDLFSSPTYPTPIDKTNTLAVKITRTQNPPYPGPNEEITIFSPNENAYPGPYNDFSKNDGSKVDVIIPITINKPVYAGDQVITGTGPTNIPIEIVDITLNGKIIGKSKINDEGSFIVRLTNNVQGNHRIGIKLGDLGGTNYNKEDFAHPGFFGDEHRLVPMMDFFFDTVLIQK